MFGVINCNYSVMVDDVKTATIDNKGLKTHGKKVIVDSCTGQMCLVQFSEKGKYYKVWKGNLKFDKDER